MSSLLEDQTLLLKKFPLLLPQNKNFTKYDGYIVVKKRYFHISATVPNYPSLRGLSFQACWELCYLLERKEKELQNIAESSTMLSLYLTSFQSLVSSCIEEKSLPSSELEHLNMESSQRLFSDLRVVGMDHVAFVSRSMTWLKLKVVDDAERIHIIRLDVGDNYPHHNIQIQADLPQTIIEIIKENTSLVGIYRSFVQQVSSLQNVWDQLHSLDEECWILDPEKPTWKDMTRRIVIGPNVCLQLTFNPSNATSLPSLKFYGPEPAIQPFRESLAANLEDWQDSSSLVENLKCVLGIDTFPVAADHEDQAKKVLVYEGECSICYAVQLDEELPSIVCENTKCANLFHASCLLQWLQCLPGNLQSFNRVHGTCPACSTAISCPVSC